jgi:hypothetical protein
MRARWVELRIYAQLMYLIICIMMLWLVIKLMCLHCNLERKRTLHSTSLQAQQNIYSRASRLSIGSIT